MRKLFLLGTMLGVAGTALAFGGVFNHGSKSTTYKGGVDAIGVHVNGKGKADIDIRSCDSETEELVGSECCLKTLIYTDNDTTKCCSTEGYAVQDGKCKKQCEWGWILNEENNECECPPERLCGTTCCGVGNICNHETNQCCYENYQEFTDDPLELCCEAGSMGYANQGGCCANGEKLYAGYQEEGGYLESYCAPSDYTLTPYGNEEGGGFVACEAGLWGYRNGDGVGCCTHTPNHVVDTDFCCEQDETAFCQYIHYEQCEDKYGGCCSGAVSCTNVADEDELERCGCCPVGQSVYCPDARCEQDEMPCCPNDKISYGTGENGADECLE